MLVWHYSTGEKLKRIVETGALPPTVVGIAAGIRTVAEKLTAPPKDE
jgi:hypothetical protein